METSMSATLPVFQVKTSAKVVFAISLLLWVLAITSYIIAFVNYNNSNQKIYNFWQTLGSIFVWLQIFTILALVGTPNLFSKY
jgi:hypothetical protein